MSGRDIEGELSDFFRRTATPEPSLRLREAVTAARLEPARRRVGAGRLGVLRRPRRALSLVGLAACVVLAVGLLLVVVNREDRQSIAGSSPTASPSVGPSPTLRAATSATPSGHFSSTGSMSIWHTSATLLLDGRVLFLDTDLRATTPRAAELYDPATGVFSQTGSMIQAHFQGTETRLVDGRVLIAGGWGADGRTTSSAAELYDPRTGTFSLSGSMGLPRARPSAVLLRDGRVLIAGGWTDGLTLTTSAELYDPRTGEFSGTGSMMVARSDPTATLLPDGRVLIAGGLAAGGSGDPHLTSAELYDPGTGAFRATGFMTTAREFGTVTLLEDGRVLFVGGSSDNFANASAELYDPRTGVFTLTGSMPAFRRAHAAALLPDGRVLGVGGISGPVVASIDPAIFAATTDVLLSSAELYDPKTGEFSPTGSMATARDMPTATALADGRILVAGGSSLSSDPPNYGELLTAELYQP